jgi:mRNA interferase RelE/StbE
MSKIIVHRHAAKYLERLPKESRERIKAILSQVAHDPLRYPGTRHMVGEWAGYHRIRVGNLRVIFWFDENEDTVYVDHIGPRGDVYK